MVAFSALFIMFGLNLLALVWSLWLDHKGLPAAVDGQFARRKRGTLLKRLPLIGFNNFLILISVGPSLWFFSDCFPAGRPELLPAVGSFVLLVFLDDLWIYAFHRFIHQRKWWYRHVHKIHHRAFAPVPIEYLYVHPLEWAGGGVGVAAGFIGGILIFGHIPAWTLYVWAVWRVGHELDIHSGVRSVFARWIPVVAPMEHHDLHHARPMAGNYASMFSVWDRVFGTVIERSARRL